MATKRKPQKAVAPAQDDPATPFFDARAEDGKFASTEESSEPTTAEAVAEEAPTEAPAAVEPDATTTAPAPAGIVCVTCGRHAIYETDGLSAASRAYCRRDLPANVTGAMVDEYALLKR